jgi:putative ABC transport system permease protein
MLALGLGIGANTAVFTVVNGALLRPLPFPRPERLYFLTANPRNSPFGPPRHAFGGGIGIGDQVYPEFRRRVQSFDAVAAFPLPGPAALAGSSEPVRAARCRVTHEFLSVLRVSPALGRGFQDGDELPGHDNVVLLSDQLWRNHFGADRGVLGKSVTLDGEPHTVIGVMPPGFAFPPATDLWTPEIIKVSHNLNFLNVIGRLKPGIQPQRAQAELRTIMGNLGGQNFGGPKDLEIGIIPLKEVMVGESRSSLLIFSGAVAFVLLIACANVANLLLMRAASRRQEVAVRIALGAGRGRLIRQLLTESVLLSLGAGALGMLLALWAVPALLALAPVGKIPRLGEIHIGAAAFAFTMGISLVTGIAFGLVPALESTHGELRAVLGASRRTSTGRHERLRGALVVAEMALALILLTGAGLLLKSFLRIRAVDPGFHPDRLLTVTVDLPPSTYRTADTLRAFDRRVLANLSTLPGVTDAAAVNFRPLGPMRVMGTFEMEHGRKRPRGFMVDKPTVSPGYFRAMGIRLIGGREFTERDDASAAGAIVISQEVARKLWPGENPIGQRLSMEDDPKPGDWLTVVGVVDDIRQGNLKKAASPAIYQPYSQVSLLGFLSHMTFVVRTGGNPAELAPALRRVLREADPAIPPQSLATMQTLIAETTAEPLFQTRLLAVFSLVALALAAFGIYAVLAYSVEQRTREIGIRMALGAAAGDVTRMVLRRAAALVAIGLVVGAAGALAVTRVLATFLFEVQPTDGVTAVSVALLLAVVALLAGWLPARRAARLDPLAALRYE